MKKIFTIPFLVLFITVHGTGFGEFNIFLQRRIIVDSLENRGEQVDDYLRENLTEQLYLLIADAPFVSLTDRERAFLLTLSLGEEYADVFELTDGNIRYRLEPSVVRGDFDRKDYPLYVSGHYQVIRPQPDSTDETSLKLQIDVYNTMSERSRDPVIVQGRLEDFIDEPHSFLFPFLPEFLRYTIYRMNLTADPPDALISVDEELIGIGTAESILVTPGLHRISVRSDGYREYRDLVQVQEDGYRKHVTLDPETRIIQYLLSTTPDGADVYLDEKYLGSTPLLISVGPSNKTLTFSREGYRTESVVVQDLPATGGELHFGLIEAGIAEDLERKAERHRKRAKGLSYAGFAVLVSTIVFGIQTTAKQQEADLYSGTDPDRAADAQAASDLYNTLLISSIVLAGGIFTFSFAQTVQYFKTYNKISEYEQIPIVRTEVAF